MAFCWSGSLGKLGLAVSNTSDSIATDPGSPAMSVASTDRNLLFGILALQMDFVTRDQLIAGMNAWVLDKAKSLGDVLRGQRVLDDDTHALLDALVRKHLSRHRDDPAVSLAALSSLGPAGDDLQQIADPELQASLAAACQAYPDGTLSMRVGIGAASGARFRVLRPHARGSLGQVSVAIDEELHREVALKEIQEQHADHSESRARFLLEAEVTGGLEHPGVVPVYGLGTYDDGRPFYAMRFIRGDSLHGAIRRFHSQTHRPRLVGFDRLAFRQLLGRFVDVCNAIAYAHSRGVLHRDLKPGNIMLGKYGETLVVDWGLAKATGRTPGDGSGTEGPLRPAAASGSSATVLGSAVGTPAYMSPEQADGRLDELGPASDVYSLGATLYELLTGGRPFAGETVEEVLAKVRRGGPPSPRQVNPAIPRPLAAVCLKAMAPKPADRYDTALALAADVEHWLADEPVTAWKEPADVRLRRWVRKHSWLMSGAVAASIVAAAGFGLLALERERARQAVADEQARTAKERDIAREQKRRTRAALDTMVSENMIERLGSQKELTKGQREFLQTALSYYREFAAEAATGEQGRGLEADAHRRVGYLLKTLGQKEEAIAAYRRALSIFEILASDSPAVLDYRINLARGYGSLGNLLADLGQRAAAEAEYRAALAVQEKLVADLPTVPAYRSDLASSHNDFGNLLAGLGQRTAAEAEYGAALALHQRLADDFPAVPLYRLHLAKHHQNLGDLLVDTGRFPAAETEFRSALRLTEKLAADSPPTRDLRRAQAHCHVCLARLLADQGRAGAAVNECRAALALQEMLAAEFPAMPDYRRDVAASHNNLGIVLAHLGQRTAAEAEYRAALAVRETLVADFPAVPAYRSELASSHNSMGNLLAGLGRRTAAEAEYRAASAVREALVADFPAVPEYAIGLGGSYCNLGNLVKSRGDKAAALVWHTKAVDRLAPIVAAEPRQVTARQFLRNSRVGRADDFMQLKRFAEALPDWDAGLNLDDGSERRGIRAGRAECLANLGRAAEAIREADEVAGEKGARGDTLYDCARAVSVASAASDNADAHAAHAVALLRRAVTKGYNDVSHLQADADLAPLRNRADFAALLWDLADTPLQVTP
jgi:serine/threonine protein kinase